MERRYTRETSLGSFIKNIITESLTQSSWEATLCIPSSTTISTNNILENLVIIQENEMDSDRRKYTPAQYNVAKNMYVVIWRSLTSKPKRLLQVQRTQI